MDERERERNGEQASENVRETGLGRRELEKKDRQKRKDRRTRNCDRSRQADRQTRTSPQKEKDSQVGQREKYATE